MGGIALKKCSLCLQFKPLNEFSTVKRVLSNGVQKVCPVESCKSCRNKKRRVKYQEEKNSGVRYIYRFADKNGNIIYIGKTNNLKIRIRNHLSTKGHLPKECYEKIYKIEFMVVCSDVLMDIKELYYINLYKPRFNYINKHNSPSFIISDFVSDKWIDYNDFNLYYINNINNIKLLTKDYHESDMKNVKSIFKRKRGNKYAVYIEYCDFNDKVIQKRKASFETALEADKLILDLRKIYK